MTEIWLNYGMTDVVLDIKAENLEQKIDTPRKTKLELGFSIVSNSDIL